ncbi:MAG: S9 family peptidase [Acidimicrobiia bacterium]|nr:S9 family peptidase [Acidimicrobiia bacterium]
MVNLIHVLKSATVVALSACLACAAKTAHGSEIKKLSTSAIVAMRAIQGLAVSPAGDRVVFVVNEPYPDAQSKEAANTELWIASVDGKSQRRLTESAGTDASPAWNPAGAGIAFLSSRSGASGNQLFWIDPDSGVLRQLTRHEGGTSSFAWSPDGKQIAYLGLEPLGQAARAKRDMGDDEMVFTLSDDLQHAAPQKLWLLDVASGNVRQLPTGHYHVFSVTWSPDGRQLLLAVTDEANMDHEWTRSKLAVLPLSGGEPRIVCRTQGRVLKPKWRPGSRAISFLMSSADGREAAASSLYTCNEEGGQALNLTEGVLATVQGYSWLPDGQALILSVVEKNERYLAHFNASTRAIRRISNRPQIASQDPSLSADGKVLAISLESPSTPPDLWAGPVSGTLRQISRLNPELESFRYGETEDVEWKAPDGLTINGVLVKPAGYQSGRRYPLIVQVHGGPESVELNGFQINWAQFFAAHDYAVFLPNFRGSVGRGVQYTVINNRDFGGKDFQDILSGVDYLVQKGIADPDRLGIGGWSYGGFMSAWAVTQTQRFKAAVVGVGVSNWFSLMGQTPVPLWTVQVHFEEWPGDNPSAFRKNSPIEFVNNVKTPTLWLHGEVDPMIALSQSREFFRALQHLKVPSELVVYPREGHGLREPVHRKRAYDRILAWYDRYVKSGL